MRQRLTRLLNVVNGWDLFMATGILLVALNGHLDERQSDLWWPPVVLAMVWYLLVGRRAGDQRAQARGLVFSIGAIVLANWAVYVNPFLAALSYILIFYMWWVTLPNRRRAIGLTVTLFATTAVTHVCADYLRDGFAHSSPIVISLWVPLVNLVGLVAICLWIDKLFRWGQERLTLVRDLREAADKEVQLQRETAALTERTRLAQEVHDTVAQDLAGLRFLVAQAHRLATPLTAGATLASADAEALEQTFGSIAAALDTTLAETRGLIATTMPVQLGSSLAETVERIAARFSRETGIATTVEVTDVRLPREAEVVFVRCFQEGLSNVRKHAQATAVDATITAEGDVATLRLTDNGIGIGTVSTADVGFGLPGLRERVELLAGSFSISSAGAGQGTTMVVSLPSSQPPPSDVQRGPTNGFSAILDEFMHQPPQPTKVAA